MPNLYKICGLFLIFILSMPVKSQKFEWEASFYGFSDNREYSNEYAPSKTMFGAWGSGAVGFRLQQHHHFRFGINYLYEFGSSLLAKNPEPVLYYHYDKAMYDFYIGAFHREELLAYPGILMSGTTHYYRPLIEGMYASIGDPSRYHTFWIDWTSRQTKSKRETFLFGFSGKYQFPEFQVRHHFLMYHRAGTAIQSPDDHIRDNGGYCLRVGKNLSANTVLDSLYVSLGGIFSIDRLRGVYGWNSAVGGKAKVMALYRSFGMKLSVYQGKGHALAFGNPIYQAPSVKSVYALYNPFNTAHIKGTFEFGFHLIDGYFDYTQEFTLYMKLDKITNLKNNRYN